MVSRIFYGVERMRGPVKVRGNPRDYYNGYFGGIYLPLCTSLVLLVAVRQFKENYVVLSRNISTGNKSNMLY